MQMNAPHTIRLRGPWNITPLDLPHPETLRGHIGCTAVHQLGGYRGPVQYVRQFNRPTGLTPEHRVMLRITQVAGHCQIGLNGQSCELPNPQEGPMEFDITTHLRPSNQLTLVVRPDDDPCDLGITGDVLLDIYSPE